MIAKMAAVQSLDQPELEIYRTLRRTKEHNDLGVFVAEGNKVVVRLLASPITVLSVLLTESWFLRVKDDIERRPEPVEVYVGSEQMVKSIVGFNYHQGIMAIAKAPDGVSIDTLCKGTAEPHLFVALDHLSNAENTGVILRNCAGCGVQAVISSESSADPYLRRSVRNSMGAVFKLPVVYSGNLAQTLDDMRTTYNCTIVAAHLHPESVSLHEVNFAKNCCIVLGNEQHGVSEKVLSVCDTVMKIPMHPGIDSFNVGCASAIILYEALRQRQAAME